MGSFIANLAAMDELVDFAAGLCGLNPRLRTCSRLQVALRRFVWNPTRQ
jgi:hypothetical protein